MGIIATYIHKYINLKFGAAGAFLMGGIVFFINLDHGWKLSTLAGAKQWVYTFFFGGMIIKLFEVALDKTQTLKYSTAISVMFIAVLTSLLVFLVHSIKGTPEPFYSTLPTIILSPPGFLYIASKIKKASFASQKK